MQAPSVEDEVVLEETGEEFGVVRDVRPGGRPELVIYVENAGDFVVSLESVRAVHDGKVVVDANRLEPSLREVIARAHTAEDRY